MEIKSGVDALSAVFAMNLLGDAGMLSSDRTPCFIKEKAQLSLKLASRNRAPIKLMPQSRDSLSGKINAPIASMPYNNRIVAVVFSREPLFICNIYDVSSDRIYNRFDNKDAVVVVNLSVALAKLSKTPAQFKRPDVWWVVARFFFREKWSEGSSQKALCLSD